MEWTHGAYTLTDDAKRLDLDAVCALLKTTYWANDRARDVIAKSIQHSICFALLHEGRQIGFCRGVTDYSTFTWIADVVVAPEHRGRGLGKWMMECLLSHPELQTISHQLCTKDAHELYEPLGFQRIEAMRRSSRPPF